MQTALIIDTEVASLKHREVVQVAWQVLPGDDIQTLHFNPLHDWELGCISVHKMLPEDVRAKAVDTSDNAFKHIPPTDYVIGHNIDFDAEALGGMPGVKRICTLAMARAKVPSLDSHQQSAVYLYVYGVNRQSLDVIRKAHQSAADDVKMCRSILPLVSGVQINEGDGWLERMWLVSEAARVPKVMPFGKHKGELIEDVPSDYKRWLLNRDDLDPYLRKALEGKWQKKGS